MTTKTPFTIQTKELARYMRTSNMIAWVAILAMLWIVPLLVSVENSSNVLAAILITTAVFVASGLFVLMGVTAYVNKFVASLGYELDGDTLRIKQGVFNWERRAIPMDRVTDVRMSQGILMRQFGIWRIDVQTASQGDGGAEGTLHAIADPKHVRETLLAARTAAAVR